MEDVVTTSLHQQTRKKRAVTQNKDTNDTLKHNNNMRPCEIKIS